MAQKLYERGSDLISNSQLSKDEEKETVKVLRIALHLNQAACHLKLNEPSLALKECEEVRFFVGVSSHRELHIESYILPPKTQKEKKDKISADC